MLRFTLSSIMALSVASASAVEAQSLEGIWRLVGAETRDGPDAESIENQGGLLTYGGEHFLWRVD